MKFNCDYFSDIFAQRKAERRAKRWREYYNARHWHIKFAWLPVKVGHNDCRWLEPVWQYVTASTSWNDCHFEINTTAFESKPPKNIVRRDRLKYSYEARWNAATDEGI